MGEKDGGISKRLGNMRIVKFQPGSFHSFSFSNGTQMNAEKADEDGNIRKE
jgi:hypothetical protein